MVAFGFKYGVGVAIGMVFGLGMCVCGAAMAFAGYSALKNSKKEEA